MSRITITLTIDVPDGATVAVNQGDNLATLPPVANATVAATPDAPICGVHHKPMRIGRYGPYCTQQAGPGEAADAKGYCSWRVK